MTHIDNGKLELWKFPKILVISTWTVDLNGVSSIYRRRSPCPIDMYQCNVIPISLSCIRNISPSHSSSVTNGIFSPFINNPPVIIERPTVPLSSFKIKNLICYRKTIEPCGLSPKTIMQYTCYFLLFDVCLPLICLSPSIIIKTHTQRATAAPDECVQTPITV